MSNKWIRKTLPKAEPAARLLCFHQAGGSAQFFSSWAKLLPDEIEICAIQLPGRAERMREPLCDDPKDLLLALQEHLPPLLDRPFFVLGLSFGSLVAFNWIRQLRESNLNLPKRFFIVSCNAPQIPRQSTLMQIEDPKEFITAINKVYGGLPSAIFNDEQFTKVVANIFRADFEIIKKMTHESQPPLDIPFFVARGKADSRVSLEWTQAWQEHSSKKMPLQEYEGGHFFMENNPGLFLTEISKQIQTDLLK